MTDRERLLELVEEHEEKAQHDWHWLKRIGQGRDPEYAITIAGQTAQDAAHHALTAMALREAVDIIDTIRPWQAPLNPNRYQK